MQDRLLVEACYKSHEKLIDLLLVQSFFDDHIGDRACIAATVEQIAIARDLLHVIRFYVDYHKEHDRLHSIVKWACQRPSLVANEEYQRIFDSLMNVIPTHSDRMGRYLGKAAKCGNRYVVDRLLDIEHIDPSAYENDALCKASRYGHVDVVQRLLRDPRVDPVRFGHRALGVARSFNQAAIARLIVESSRIDFQCISVQDSMDMAVDAHNTKLIVALLAEGRATLSHAQIISLLGNPTANWNPIV